MRGGVSEPAGLFQPQPGEDAATNIEGSTKGADGVAVTVEPSGGSQTPSSDLIMKASWLMFKQGA